MVFPLRPPHVNAADKQGPLVSNDEVLSLVGAITWEEARIQHGSDAAKINLRSLTYRLSLEPLVPGCSCYACRCHSRAYIHHLLNTHEMLAEVLLCIHNNHHYLQFFQAIREAINAGRFTEYVDWFNSSRHR
eukprot:TRINITY_DN661_c0_g7_i1.p1 TRINITY_DN661_c0_g7~~TRINITY_DN661_c0_g7_i1.p1  ORF type:complete len:132 (-),score=4.27 TRINITY_DN661_c0_g7_i1:597-992(-)